jgi:hypothetical protein
MSIVTITSTSRGKCISCSFYSFENGYWPGGVCSNKGSKVKRKQRNWNDKICVNFKRGKELGDR